MAVKERESAAWISGDEAQRLLNLPDHHAVERLAETGLIDVRRLPGVRARFRKSDVDQLVMLSTPKGGTTSRTETAADAS